MTDNLPKADRFTGKLEIGGAVIPCAVLEDGRRVLSESGIAESFGSRTGGAKKIKQEALKSGRAPLPIFLAPKGLKPFISKDLEDGLMNPIQYRVGRKVFSGYEATLLPVICDVWLHARQAGALQEQQKSRAMKAEILMRGLAHIGIIALVDEATGYQEIRDKKALAALLDKYLLKELAAWAKRFPDEFYREIFRLRGWKYNPASVSRPSVVGRYTNDIVYERLAPGLLEELKKRTPKNEAGKRKGNMQQMLTEDVGHPALAQHLHAVIALMRASSKWDDFYRLLQRALPKKGEQLPLLTVD